MPSWSETIGRGTSPLSGPRPGRPGRPAAASVRVRVGRTGTDILTASDSEAKPIMGRAAQFKFGRCSGRDSAHWHGPRAHQFQVGKARDDAAAAVPRAHGICRISMQNLIAEKCWHGHSAAAVRRRAASARVGVAVAAAVPPAALSLPPRAGKKIETPCRILRVRIKLSPDISLRRGGGESGELTP